MPKIPQRMRQIEVLPKVPAAAVGLTIAGRETPPRIPVLHARIFDRLYYDYLNSVSSICCSLNRRAAAAAEQSNDGFCRAKSSGVRMPTLAGCDRELLARPVAGGIPVHARSAPAAGAARPAGFAVLLNAGGAQTRKAMRLEGALP